MMDRISTVFFVLWEEEEEQTATRCAVSGEIGNKDQRRRSPHSDNEQKQK